MYYQGEEGKKILLQCVTVATNLQYQSVENFWTILFGNVEESLILYESIPLDMLFEKVAPKVGGKT